MGRGRRKGKCSNIRKESNEPPAKRRNQVDPPTTVAKEFRRGGCAVRDQGRCGDSPADLRQEENSDESLKRQDILTLVHEVLKCLSSQAAVVVPTSSSARQEGLEIVSNAITTMATTSVVQDPSGPSSLTPTTLVDPATSSSAFLGATQLQPEEAFTPVMEPWELCQLDTENHTTTISDQSEWLKE